MDRIAWTSIVTVLAAGMAYGNSMPPEPPATRPAVAAGKIVKGLQLSLSADKTETTPDGVVKLTIALVNRGTEPIKYLQYPQVCGPWLKVTGPDGKAIQCIRDPRAPQASLPAPDMQHVRELAPGAKWEHVAWVSWTVLDPPVEDKNRITGKVIRRYDGCGWDIRKPGRYTIVASYAPTEDARKINAKHQASVWDGEVESNPIVFTVKPTEPAPATKPAAVDPKTASLADALTDWIALLEKDDAKTATARWATNAAVGGKVTAEWKGLRECHKQYDYRRWIENSSDEPTTGLVPGGAKRIGKDTTFRVGGHGFGHLHVMWEKTHSGWRIASILECM